MSTKGKRRATYPLAEKRGAKNKAPPCGGDDIPERRLQKRCLVEKRDEVVDFALVESKTSRRDRSRHLIKMRRRPHVGKRDSK